MARSQVNRHNFCLKAPRDRDFLIGRGIEFHIFGPMYLIDC